jgi:AraC family transcriptional regulator
MTMHTPITIAAAPDARSISLGPSPMQAMFMGQTVEASRRMDGSGPTGDASGQKLVISTVVRLLDDATCALETDRAVAKTHIARASAMLLAEEDRRTYTPPALARGGLAPWQLRRVTTHIDASLEATIRLSDVAALTGLSTSHFARAFKVSAGVTAHAYIIQRRIRRAQEMMLTSGDSLCQIALACGLCDQAHFSRLFRRLVGISPSAWRRQWAADNLTAAA